jgi:peptidyl-tRNA hydrolase, PTH1 family
MKEVFDFFRERRRTEGPAGPLYIVVGLGNPGEQYANNRHNFGFMVIDRLAERLEVRLSRFQQKAIIGQGQFSGRRILLAKPQTFMNLSGQSVRGLVKFYKASLENVLIVHDDLDLPFATIRLRPSGGAGGQKGIRSIIEHLGGQEFSRLRLGIDRPPGRMSASSYVLQDFGKPEREILPVVLKEAADAVIAFFEVGITEAMNQFNGPAKRS